MLARCRLLFIVVCGVVGQLEMSQQGERHLFQCEMRAKPRLAGSRAEKARRAPQKGQRRHLSPSQQPVVSREGSRSFWTSHCDLKSKDALRHGRMSPTPPPLREQTANTF